jgi:hypothetical protein
VGTMKKYSDSLLMLFSNRCFRSITVKQLRAKKREHEQNPVESLIQSWLSA